MKLDPVRLARQELAFERWRAGKEINGVLRQAVGIFEAITGFGKTYVLILAIRFMNSKYPDRNAIIIVPTTKLLEDWTGYYDSNKQFVPGHIQKHNLVNLRVFVVNTFVKYKDWECDLLGLDECHRYANSDSQFFSTVLSITKFKFLWGMSATLSKKEKDFFASFNIPIIDTVDELEGQKYGYVAPSVIYNLGVKLSPADQDFNDKINDKFKFYFGRFQNEFELVKACNAKKNFPIAVRLKNGTFLEKRTPAEWIKEIARINNFNGDPKHPYSPQNIARNAAQCMAVIHERKNMWQNFPSKIDIAVKIIKKFPHQILIFSETSAFADKLAAEIPDICVAYHTNLPTVGIKGEEEIIVQDAEHKKKLQAEGYVILGNAKRKSLALKRFIDPNDPIRAMSTVKALDEGVDIPSVSMTLQCAYSSKARQGTQRRGRAGRVDYDNKEKKALNICLYMMGTQEEKWLKSSQEGKTVINVESIEQINPNQIIALGSNYGTDEEIVIEESDIESGVSGIDGNEGQPDS
jgi:superfamily II DNA or RNA helicase